MSQLQGQPATQYLLSLDPSVRQRAAEAFAVDETGRHAGTLLDPLNVTGRRAQVINDILNNNPNIGSTMSPEGKFDIPWNDRLFAGINDDDIAKALAIRAQRGRIIDPALGGQARMHGVKFDTLTSDEEILRNIENEKNYKEDIKPIRAALAALPGGAQAFRALGDKPSVDDASGLLTRLSDERNRDPKNITSDYNTTLRGIEQNTKNNERLNRGEDRADRIEANNLASTKFNQELALLNHKTNDDWKRFELAMRQADREQTRRDNRQQLLWQMEQRNLDRAYNRERDERADSRAKAQQRLALILKMIGGIG